MNSIDKTLNGNTLDLLTIKRAVYSWSIRFQGIKYTNEQLARLSVEYLEDLQAEGVTLRQFDAAARLVRRRGRFFPSMVEILDAVQECRCKPELIATATTAPQIEAHTATPDNLTAEEINRNRERVRLIAKALAGQLSWDEAERSVAQMGHINEFSGTAPEKMTQGGMQ